MQRIQSNYQCSKILRKGVIPLEAYNPKTLQELVINLGNLTPLSKILAGGTDLIINLKQTNTVDKLLYLGRIPQLKVIKITDDALEIGATATMSEIANSPVIPYGLNAIKQAAADMGSTQVRNSATIGGNIAGASPAADLLPVLFLLDAKAVILDANGNLYTRQVADLITGAGQTKLSYNEVITKFIIPLKKINYHTAFRKLGFRNKVTIARISAALGWSWDQNNTIGTISLYLGALSPIPIYCNAAEILIGTVADEQAVNSLSKELSGLIDQVIPNRSSRMYKAKAIYGLMQDLFISL